MTPGGSTEDGRALDDSLEPSLDRWLELLAHRDRRVVLSTLVANDDDRLPVGVLTDVVAGDRPTETTPQSVLIGLHHVHLPKLQRADVIEYHPDESMVTYRGHEELERCLHAIEDAAAD